MLYEAMPKPDPEADLPALARDVVARFDASKTIVPGIGHPFHKPIDPRTPRLIALAKETGFHGRYVELIQAIAAELSAARASLCRPTRPACWALCCEMGFDWKICRGLGVIARAVGLVGHILEESRNHMAQSVWLRTEAEATDHFRAETP